MAQVLTPQRGHWYKRSDLDTIFEVVALDDDEGTIEVQYFGGEIEEFDINSWQLLELSQAAPPEDWSGALEVDDYTLGDELELAPGSLDDVLNIIDSNENDY